MRVGLLVAVLLSAFPVAVIASPSFDCARAATPTERAICASSVLSDLDVALAQAYRAARSGVSEPLRARVRAEQVAWLAARDRCGGDRLCLEQVMRTRLAVLRAPSTRTAPRPAATALNGIWCARGGADILALEQRGDGLLFSISSWQASGHSCGTPTLAASRRGSAFVARDGGCTFALEPLAGGIRLEVSGGEACQRRYCGARARLGRHDFPATGRRPLPAPIETAALMKADPCR